MKFAREVAYIPWKGRPIQMCSRESVAYREAGWWWGARLGEKMGPVHSDGTWSFPGHQSKSPDVRLLPPEAIATLADFDREVEELNRRRREYIEEHFRQWPLLRKDEVPHYPGRTKAEVIREARERGAL